MDKALNPREEFWWNIITYKRLASLTKYFIVGKY